MIHLTPHLARAIDIAAAFVARELHMRQRLDPDCGMQEVWASVTPNGHILIGTPVLHPGQGVYVNCSGLWREP